MFQFEESLESVFAQCVPFDESPLRQCEDYEKNSLAIQCFREFAEILDPEVVKCIDAYLNTYLALVDLECRHYFAEGYRLGRESAAN